MPAGVAIAAIVNDDNAVSDLVAAGLEDALLSDLRRSIERDSRHPARALRNGQKVIRGVNPGGDPRSIGLPASHPPVHAYLFVPVAAPSHVYGHLCVVETQGRATFSDEDTEVVSTLGALAGLACENVQLQAEAEELHDHEERTEFAMAAAGMAVWYRNVDESWMEVSRSTAELLGLPSHLRRVPPEHLYDRIHPDDRPLVRAAVERAVEDRSETTLDFRPAANGENGRWLQLRGRVVADAQERSLRVIAVITDITERRRLGLRLRQAQKMEALAQLAGGVAHDFNNLLTAITGYGRFALDSASDPSQRHNIEQIVTAADRATALTQRLLAFSRRQTIEAAVCDLNELISGMIQRLRSVVGEHIDLTTSLLAESAHVRANRSQLEQVVMTLVSNARDACRSGGHIHLSTESIDVAEPGQGYVPGLNRGLYVTLSVVDDGSGMDEATRSRLFEPFFSTKPRGHGTGLGLASVYGIVVQSGGGIQVESEPGQGSTFTVYFPREHEMSLPAERPIDSSADIASLSVLLVEDDQAVRELVRMMLQRAGHRVVEAGSAEEAMTRFDTMPSVDLLVTDVVMPGTSGFDLFQTVVERRPSLRVLFISGYTDYAPFDETIGQRRAGYLEKPFSANALTSKIRDLFSD
jgi:signal transduction histidine kinase